MIEEWPDSGSFGDAGGEREDLRALGLREGVTLKGLVQRDPGK